MNFPEQISLTWLLSLPYTESQLGGYMGDATPTSGPIRFGVFELDVPAGELRKNGSHTKLQEQPFQILRLLLERPG